MNDSLNELRALDRAALIERWRQVFRCPAPRYAHVELLRGALAWQMQAVAAGVAASARRRLVKVLRGSGRSKALSPGTQLLREWNGRTYRVTVSSHGFDCDGRTYRSLTAIARAITGTAWSGPAFFGLRR